MAYRMRHSITNPFRSKGILRLRCPSIAAFRTFFFKIDVGENKNGRLLAAYVLKYFDDMWRHFQSLAGVLNDGASIHYIVGNSTLVSVAGRARPRED